MKHFKKVALSLSIILIIIVVLPWFPAKIFKVTSPNDSKFNIERFQFKDYDSRNFEHALSTMFPVGTEKEYIDHILVKIGKAHYEHGPSNYHHYTKSKLVNKAYFFDYYVTQRCQDYRVSVCYDSEQNLKHLMLSAPCTMSIIGKDCPYE